MEVVSDKAVNRRAIYYCSFVEVLMIDDDDNNNANDDRCGDSGRQAIQATSGCGWGC
jgi:hypothetical protein